jgi:hypothetical protein
MAGPPENEPEGVPPTLETAIRHPYVRQQRHDETVGGAHILRLKTSRMLQTHRRERTLLGIREPMDDGRGVFRVGGEEEDGATCRENDGRADRASRPPVHTTGALYVETDELLQALRRAVPGPRQHEPRPDCLLLPSDGGEQHPFLSRQAPRYLVFSLCLRRTPTRGLPSHYDAFRTQGGLKERGRRPLLPTRRNALLLLIQQPGRMQVQRKMRQRRAPLRHLWLHRPRRTLLPGLKTPGG